MWYRRGVFAAMPIAVVALPAWLLISRGLIFPDSGWDFLGYLILAPILGLALAAVAGLVWARHSVRTIRAVSVLDAAVLSAWYLSIVAYGLAGDEGAATVIAVLGVLLGVGAIWLAAMQLVRETRNRFRSLAASFEQQARPRDGFASRPGDGPVIRIEPPAERPER